MFGPGGEGFIRINVGCPKAIVEKALTQIKIAVNNI
jgi:cystathionine beta-lyase